MAGKRTNPLPEAPEVQHQDLTNTVVDDKGVILGTETRPAFENAEEQQRRQAPDSSQVARPPADIQKKQAESAADARRLGVSAGMRAGRAMFPDQNDRLRAVPAVPSDQGGAVTVADNVFQPSALVDENAEHTRFDADDFGNSIQVLQEAQAAGEPSPLEEAMEVGEPMVVVNPRQKFDCTIGHHHWYFEKGVRVKVPQSVRDVLARGDMIHP